MPRTAATASRNSGTEGSPLRSIMLRSRNSSMTISDILALALRVVEDGADDQGLDDLAAFEREGQRLAHAAPAVLDQRHGDRALERRAQIARGDMADRRRRPGIGIANRMGAVGQHLLRILGQEADQLLAAGGAQISLVE